MDSNHDDMDVCRDDNRLKAECLRCLKTKRGVHLVNILGYEYAVCNRCAIKIMNLLELRQKSSNLRQLNWIERQLFNSRAKY